MSFKYDEKAKKTFCPLAWNHSFVNQDGSLQLCCTSEEFDNYIRDENNEKIFVDDGKTPEEIMNTPFMKKIRLQMLNGVWPEACRRCLLTEKMNGSSRRNSELEHYNHEIENLISATEADGTIPNLVTSTDYRLGNLCNLQCRMCNPRSTKLWIKDWNEMKTGSEIFSPETMESYTKYDWIDSDALVRDFELKSLHLEHIHFAGGEPLLVPQMAKILQKCIDNGSAKNIIITYNTNLTLLPKNIIELWKHFKGIKILASIDAVGGLNYYIRYPAKWEQIDKNLRLIDEHHKEYNILECIVSTTVQALNILHLDELYDYLNSFKFVVKAPNLISLYFPFYLQSIVLPPKLKILAQMKLKEIDKKVKPRLEPHYHYLLDNLVASIHFMNSKDGYTEMFDQFKDFQTKFDAKKNLNLLDYSPYFQAYYGPNSPKE